MQSDPESTTVSLPTDLESPRAKLVYVYLTTAEETSLEALREELALTTGDALSILGTLRKRGYVTRTDGGYALA